MTLRMYDSIYVHDLPPGADAYLGYVDGNWPTWAILRRWFTGAHILGLAVLAADDADGCDCEQFDLSADQVPAWVRRQHARGVARPVVYASISAMPRILALLSAAGISRASVRLLSAHYAGKHICGPATCDYSGGGKTPQMDGTQWTDQAAGNGGMFIDESLLADDFFGGDVALTSADAQTIVHAGINARGTTVGEALQAASDGIPAVLTALAALSAKVGASVDEAAIAAAVIAGIEQAGVSLSNAEKDAIAAASASQTAALFGKDLGGA